MKCLTRNVNLAICLLLCGTAWLGLGSAVAVGQEGAPDAQPVVHNAPESITGTLEGNKTDLLSTWRLLSDLAVRLFSGNETELLSGNSPELLSGNSPELLSGNSPELLSGNSPELLSGNSPELLSGNSPELLSGNETSLLSENDPHLLSGNRVVLFSHNTLQIHLTECGNNNTPPQGAPARDLSALRIHSSVRSEQAKPQEVKMQGMQAQMKAAQTRVKAVIEKEQARAKTLANELSGLRARVQELAAQNSALQAKIAELETANR